MKQKELIPLSERWEQLIEQFFAEGMNTMNLVHNYNDYVLFIKEKLSEPYQVNGVTAHPLNRFVACDLEGNVLEDPQVIYNEGGIIGNKTEIKEFQEAQNRVLFKGVEIRYDDESFLIIYRKRIIGYYKSLPNRFVWNFKTIEGLTKLSLTLTETGFKLAGINFNH